MPLTDKQGRRLIQVLEENKMIENFYKELEKKIESKDYCVYDMIIENNKNITGDKKLIRELLLNNKKNCSVVQELNRDFCNKYLINLLKKSLTKGIKKIDKIYDFDDNEILEMMPDEFSYYDSWVIFGCPFSTDIDMIVFVRCQDHNNGKTKPLAPTAIKSIISEIKVLGYDVVNKSLDINPVYVDPETKMIIASIKASTETQNIINATWKYHRQILDATGIPKGLKLHPMKDIEFTDEEIRNKMRVFAKYALDYAKDICPDYKKIHQIKMDIYAQSGDKMIMFMRHILEYIEPDLTKFNESKDLSTALNCCGKWYDRFKALTMKLIQLLLLWHHKKTIYTKLELAESLNILFAYTENTDQLVEGAKWYLFRGTRGTFNNEVFGILLVEYSQIAEKILNKNHEIFVTVNSDRFDEIKEKFPQFDPLIINLFIESPIIYTKQFESVWTKLNESKDINTQFLIKSSKKDVFFNQYQKLEPQVIEIFNQCFIFMDQRSEEWMDCLVNKFICGRNSGNIDNSFQGKYNLIRGSILELMAMHFFDPLQINLKNFRSWYLGFIVEENIKGAHGFAPDMILISEDNGNNIPEFILVEIKGLKYSKKNADYYRGLDLATKQITSGKNILSKKLTQSQLCINRGIIILCCIENQQFKMELHLISL